MTSASLTLAVQIPTEPVSICIWAIAGHLCVFAWGRLAIPFAPIAVCILARFVSSRSRSTQSAGVVEFPFRDIDLHLAVNEEALYLGSGVTAHRCGNPDGGRPAGLQKTAPVEVG